MSSRTSARVTRLWRVVKGTPWRAAQSETAAAQGYAVVAFLLDRYGLAPWQRFVVSTRTAPDMSAALALAYGKPAAALENEFAARKRQQQNPDAATGVASCPDLDYV